MTMRIGSIQGITLNRSRQYLCLKLHLVHPTVAFLSLRIKSNFWWRLNMLLRITLMWTKSLLHARFVVVPTTLNIAWKIPNKLLRTTHPRVPTKREVSGSLSSPSKTTLETPTTIHGETIQTLGGDNPKTLRITQTHLIVNQPPILHPSTPNPI